MQDAARATSRGLVYLLLLGILVVLQERVSAQAYNSREVQKLFAADGTRTDYFGHWISIDGDTAVIGTSADDDRGTDSGSAYVFARGVNGAWIQGPKLLASDGTRFDSFGVAVSVSGDTAVIGAYHDDSAGPFSGSAYVFVRDEGGDWVEQAKLVPANGAPYTYFGGSVAVHGDLTMIGSALGVVYVFSRDSSGHWTELPELLPSDGVPFDDFGYSLALDGGIALIGAPRTTENNPGAGAAYIFAPDADGMWREQAKLVDRDGQVGDRFGWSVAIDGATALVSAYGPNAEGRWSGAAHVFARIANEEWPQVATLMPSDGNLDTAFGWSVALEGHTALVGAREAGDNGIFSGAAYVFAKSSAGAWTERAKMLASDGSEYEYFGSSVALEPGGALIGALLGDGVGPATGAAYHYSLPVQITIDIKPEDDVNSVNVRSRGVLPVAVLGASHFDVTTVDVDSVKFGPLGAVPVHLLADPFVYADHLQDVNSDGYTDLVMHFSVWRSGIACGQTGAILTAETVEGHALEGADSIRTVDCRQPSRGDRSERDRGLFQPRAPGTLIEIQR